MAWASDDVLGFGEPRYSLGARVDWFEDDVFAKGWHSNAVLKYDFGDDDFTGFRLKLLQTYQAVYHDVFFNAGIGVQFAENSEYSTRILPAWELSIGRAF
jgi:hypothetical protein